MESSFRDPSPGRSELSRTASQQALDVDDDDGDGAIDSAYGSVNGSILASLTSSMTNYKYENGRRYHAYREGQYVLPNDEREQERLDLQHHIWRLTRKGDLFTVPLANPLRILDLGTGTGIWAIDMADEFPTAEVEGTDLSPIQPGWVPPNCSFQVHDFDDVWGYTADQAFDYIHGRALSGSSRDWPRFFSQVYSNLRPGGWVEMQELDVWVYTNEPGTEHRIPRLSEWNRKLNEASSQMGRPMNVAPYHKQWMIDAGFVSVQEIVHRVPIGSWAKDPHLKELGKLEGIQVQMAAEAYIPAVVTRVLGYTQEQVSETLEECKSDLRRKNVHLFNKYRFISGQRPAGSESA